MKNRARHCVLLASVSLFGIGAYAAPILSAPQPGHVVVETQRVTLSVGEAPELLSSERHMDLVPQKGFEAFDPNSPEYAVYQKQLQAIEFARLNQVVAMIPQLLNYADYPADNHYNSPYVPRGDVQRTLLESVWPVYRSIKEMGIKASPELQKFIADDQQPLRLRLTALQILRDISGADAQVVGPQLQVEAQRSGQTGAAFLVDSIVSGQLPFWGKIDFEPVTLTQQQVAELLTSQRHLKNAFLLLWCHGWSSHARAMFAKAYDKGHDIDVDYALFLQQGEAIRTAGELRLLTMIPALVQFMNYPSRSGDVGFVSIDDHTVSGDRRKYAAIDALLKMGEEAKAPLMTLASTTQQDVELRLRALYVLYYLDDQASQTIAQAMVAEFEKAGDTKTVTRIRGAVSNGAMERSMSHVL